MTSFGVSVARAASPPEIREGRHGNFELRLDGRTWLLRREAFGKNAKIEKIGHKVRVESASWTGTGIGYAIEFEFTDIPNAGWKLNIVSPAMGIDARGLDFGAFLSGRVAAEGTKTASGLRAALHALGWTAGGWGGGTIAFLPDQSWRIRAPGGASAHDRLATTDALLVRVHGPKNSPLDRFRQGRTEWSTSASANDPALRRRPRLSCSPRAGDRVELRPRNLDSVLTVKWDGNDSAVGLSGVWRLDLRNKRGRWTGFESARGLVLIGQGADGQAHFSAALPLSKEPHGITTPGGTAVVRGTDERHRAEIRAGGGLPGRCEVRADTVSIPIRVKGADYSQIEFDGQDLLVIDEGSPQPNDPWELILSTGLWGRWWIPLDNARLRVARARDLLSLNFRFRDVALVRRIGGWRFEQAKRDSEPILVAEFPPQHVMEQAFFAQVDTHGQTGDREIPPKVPLQEQRLRNSDGSPGDAEQERDDRDPDYPTPVIDPPSPVVEARLSGPSQLAFRLERLSNHKRRLDLRLTLAGLTDWERLGLVVPNVARTVMKPDQKAKEQVPETDPIAIFGKLGLRAGKVLRDRMGQVTDLAVEWQGGRDKDARFLTLIELPARLLLSPDQNAVITTRSPDFSASALAHTGKTIGGTRVRRQVVPLWCAQLAAELGAGLTKSTGPELNKKFARNRVRAVGSPDFVKEAFTKSQAYEQNHDTPWGYPTRFPLSMKDRHELVALASLYALPVLPRLKRGAAAEGDKGDKLPDSAVAPEDWVITRLEQEQALFVPPAMEVRELRLSSLGGSLGMFARFEPPAAPYWKDPAEPEEGFRHPPYDALTVESWRQRTTLGRDQFAEVIYKGFLFPLGHRASLVKRTERYFVASPDGDWPVAYLLQRYFIRINDPDKTFPGLGHPFESRDFPVSHLLFRTLQTPDILDPFLKDGLPVDGIYPDGKLVLPNGRGSLFWPRVRRGLGGEVAFEVVLDGRAGIVTLPLLFLDNTAAHDPQTVEKVVKYYMGIAASTGLTTATHKGAARRYAPEIEPGSATFDTARWILGARGRGDRPGAPFQMDAAMEGADQPPFYPFMREAHAQLRSVQAFSSRTSDPAVVSYDDLFVRHGMVPSENPAQLYLAVHGYLPPQRDKWYQDAQVRPLLLDLNQNGERSGGVAQPTIVTVNLSQVSGPVGGQQAPSRPLLQRVIGQAVREREHAYRRTESGGSSLVPFAAPTGRPDPTYRAGAAPNSGSARGGTFSGADFFPKDAVLLGILSLRDIVKTALYSEAPKLLEQANAAAAEVETQLNEFLARLSGPFETAQTMLGNLKIALNTQTPAGVSVADLYPKLDAAARLAETSADTLSRRLKTAEPSDGTLARLRSLVEAGKDFNGAIVKLIAEIDRIGRDPVPAELAAFIDAVQAGARAFANGLKSLIRDRVAAAAKEARDRIFGEDQARAWVATVFGPDAYAEFARCDPRCDVREMIERLASTASEALCYEAVGRPALEAAGAAEKLIREAATAQIDDLRMLAGDAFATCERILDAVAAGLQAPIAIPDQCNSPGPIKDSIAVVTKLLQSGADTLIGPINVVEAILGKADAALVHIKRIESELAACLESMGGEVLRVSMSRARANQTDAQHRQLQSDSDQVRAKVAAALKSVSKLRSSIATTLDRMKDTVGSLKSEQKVLIAAPAQICSDFSALLGSASRWMNHRVRLVGDGLLLLRHALRAIGDDLPATPAQFAITSTNAKPLTRSADCALQTDRLVNEASRKAAELLAAGVSAARNLMTLRSAAAQRTFDRAVRDVADKIGGPIKAEIESALAEFARVHSDLSSQAEGLENELSLFAADQTNTIHALRDKLIAQSSRILDFEKFATEYERRIIGAVTAPLAAAQSQARDALLEAAQPLMRAAFTVLLELHVRAHALCEPLRLVQSSQEGDWPIFRKILELMLRPELQQTFLTDAQLKLLDEQTAELRLAIGQMSGPPSAQALEHIIRWRNRIAAIRAGGEYHGELPPALYRIAQDIGEVADSLVHGRIQDLIDVKGLRARIEQAVLDLFLPEIKLSYGFGTALNPLPPFFEMIRDKPEDYQGDGGEDLRIDFETRFDARNPGASSMSSKGVLQPFAVNIFEVVKIYFCKTEFTVENGASPKIDVKIGNVELGAVVEFIQQLQEWLGIGGDSGVYIDVRLAPPSVEAGFLIDLGTISVGTVSFVNVAAGASVELPFTNKPALIRFNLGTRNNPIGISAFPYGGLSFLSLHANPKGLVGFEASFEYGGMAVISYGPASGMVRVMTGLYIIRSGGSARLSGFFVAAGSVKIAIFGVSTCLLVSVEQGAGGQMEGSATYTFSFSIGIKDFNYSVPVHRLINKGWGGGGSRGVRSGRAGGSSGLQPGFEPVTAEHLERMAQLTGGAAVPFFTPRALPRPSYLAGSNQIAPESSAASMHADWKKYRSYFDETL